MDGQDLFDGFELDYHSSFDQKVRLVRAKKRHRLVDNRERYLALEWNAEKGQLEAQALFVRRFQQARTEETVYFYCGANDAMSERIIVDIRSFHGIRQIHTGGITPSEQVG